VAGVSACGKHCCGQSRGSRKARISVSCKKRDVKFHKVTN
jgi:hypothetical protein